MKPIKKTQLLKTQEAKKPSDFDLFRLDIGQNWVLSNQLLSPHRIALSFCPKFTLKSPERERKLP